MFGVEIRLTLVLAFTVPKNLLKSNNRKRCEDQTKEEDSSRFSGLKPAP